MCELLEVEFGFVLPFDGERWVTAAEDQLKRVGLRAPQAGTVHQLAVHTVGGVINNGETIMQIVPRADELVVEAKVAPFDIDQIATGATCGRAHHVRQPASGLRACPLTSNDAAAPTIPCTASASTGASIRGASPIRE